MISLKTINDFSEFLIEIFQKRLKEAIINDHEYTIVYFQFPNKMLLNCKNNKTKIKLLKRIIHYINPFKPNLYITNR